MIQQTERNNKNQKLMKYKELQKIKLKQRIDESKNWFLEKIDKGDRPLSH